MILLRYWRPIVAVLLIAGFAAFFYMRGHKSGLAQGRQELASYQADITAKLLEANKRADQAAQDFEDWKRKQRPKVITVVKEVDRVLDANPEWSSGVVPRGVSDALAAAARDIGASEPLGTVSAPDGGSGRQQPGPGGAISGSLDLGAGLSSEAEVAE